GERQAGIECPALRYAVNAQGILVDLIGAAIDADEHFCTEIGKVTADFRLPDILADRHADHHPSKYDRLWRWAGLEQADFIKRAIVRQLTLEADRRDLAAVEQRHTIMQRPVLHEDAADQHRRAAVRSGIGQPLKL